MTLNSVNKITASKYAVISMTLHVKTPMLIATKTERLPNSNNLPSSLFISSFFFMSSNWIKKIYIYCAGFRFCFLHIDSLSSLVLHCKTDDVIRVKDLFIDPPPPTPYKNYAEPQKEKHHHTWANEQLFRDVILGEVGNIRGHNF